MTTNERFIEYMTEAIRNGYPSNQIAARESYKAWKGEFDNEYNRRKWPRMRDRVADWLRGLPSAASIEFRDYFIGEIGTAWYFEQYGKKPTEAQVAHLIERWWDWCADALIKIWKLYDIEL